MRNLLKIFGTSAVGMGAAVLVCAANAADAGRGAYNVQRTNRAGALSGASQRMPSMPTLPINSVGNLSPNLPSGGNNVGGNTGGGTPTVPDTPDTPDVPDNPNPPTPECPDGGVKNSEYTVEHCMNDIYSCVRGGALPNGINDLFNADMRNAIMNGMGLCAAQVDRCVTTVRRDCRDVYRTAADVWIDFDSRRIQPEYYSFVLRKTGLTPYQAENTCRLLDKNTYGSSFDAVANNGGVTAEYNQNVGAYNKQHGNVLIKVNPQGAVLNDGTPGLDGSRGHYARWDATTAECYIRVAAYNKDNFIKNSWLFGAAGDDQPAEVWRAAGDTFSCNKDLFGFSLMNQTSTAAVVGVGGGTLLGGTVGAIAGHGKRSFDCARDKHREMLTSQLRAAGTIGVVNEYLVNRISAADKVMDPESCSEVIELYDRRNQIETALKDCSTVRVAESETMFLATTDINCGPGYTDRWDDCYKTLPIAEPCIGRNLTPDQCVEYLNRAKAAAATAARGSSDAQQNSEFCSFKPLNLMRAAGDGIYCNAADGGCRSSVEISMDIDRLGRVFNRDVRTLIENGEKSNMAKSIGIGAAAGAGAGAVATAITALVEHSNINCRLGDGLAQVAFGKSYSIGSLKDFYVKWNLRLPDTIAPTAQVSDCKSWQDTCATYRDLRQCRAAQFNYKPADAATTTLVRGACVASGSVCVENYPVAKSQGACQ